MINKDYSHLLCRPEVKFNEAEINDAYEGKRILITGAGGSIGSALSRRLLHANPATLYLLGHGEDSIFQLMQFFKQEHDGKQVTEIVPIIADVYSEETAHLLRHYKLDYVFHTAAHKHVGLMESNPRAALKNNTQATIWLARQCAEFDRRLVYVSTDKAVKPTTVMGASKKLAEAWIDANGKNAVTIRLGNVLGSAGSLVEIIQRRAGPDVPFNLTHRDMGRYFVTAREASGLILRRGCGQWGKFTLDMGKPLSIEALVRQLAPNMKITISGNAGVEKLVEDLFEDDEGRTCPLDGVIEFHRDVQPKLISAVLEIVEDQANSNALPKDLGRLVVDMARRV